MTKRTGVRLRAFLAGWIDATTMERFLDPVLADLQSEYEDAIRTGRRWQSRRIWVAGYIALGRVLLWQGARRGLPGLLGAGDDRRSLIRTLVVSGLLTAAATAFFVAVPLQKIWADGASTTPRLAVLLMPQGLAIVLPFSLMFGILLGTGRSAATGRVLALVLLLASISSLGVFVMRSWVAPDSNQAYRSLVFEAAADQRGQHFNLPLAKGLNELTLAELRQVVSPPADSRDFVSQDAHRLALDPPVSRRIITHHYYGRLAFAWSPLVLAIFALTLTRHVTRNRWWLGAAGVASVAGYMLLGQWLGRMSDNVLLIVIAVWLPNAVFLLMSIAISRRTLRPA